jgi:Tfp pilus assembly protein PilX
LLLVVSVLGLALNSLAVSDVSVSSNTRDSQEALAIAEAGLAHGRAILTTTGVGFNTVLQRGDGQGCSADELAGNPTGAVPAGYPTGTNLIPQAGRAFGNGTYIVAICDDPGELTMLPPNLNPSVDANNRVIIRTIGRGRNGSTATVEATIVAGASGPPGLVVNGNLRISGNPTVGGLQGTAHANADLNLTGNPCAHRSFSASGSVTASGNPQGTSACTRAGANLQSRQPTITVPVLEPDDYLSAATYRLGGDGKVRDSEPGQWDG